MSISTEEKPKATGVRRDIVIWLDKRILTFSRHWTTYIGLLVALYAGLPFLAPVAMHYNQPTIGNAIYTVYGPVCHQFAFRSWFLFGEQVAYPREIAGVAGQTFEQVASADPTFAGMDVATLGTQMIYAAKGFVGNETVGWKVAFCERDVAIYVALALACFGYGLLRRMNVKVPFLPFWAYILIAIVPMGIDGFSQLFANPPFNGFGLGFYPIRESTPLLRTLTGALFGIGNAWLVFPYIDESMVETREMLETRLVKAGIIKGPAGELTAPESAR